MNYRNPTLLKLARECPRCMCCGVSNQGQVVACHSNKQRHGKGIGHKAHDLCAYMCFDCHNLLDGRKPGWDSIQKELAFADGLFKTMLWLLQEGHLTVHSKPARTA